MSIARSAAEIAVFPLETPAVPGAVVALHIFEQRYRRLATDLSKQRDPEFVVVGIERGSEVGGGDSRFDVGVVATVAEAREFSDGRWSMVAVAGRRVTVLRWLPENPYPRALVVDRPDNAPTLSPDHLEALRAEFSLLAELIHTIEPRIDLRSLEVAAGDPIRASWQMISAVSLGSLDWIELLGIDDPDHRAVRAVAMMRERGEVLKALHG